MSKIIVDVNKISEIETHNNADGLEIVIIKGWQVVVQKDTLKLGDLIVYFPPDSLLPLELSDRLMVTKYLSKGRVKSIKLRGEPSHGFAVPLAVLPELLNYQEGHDCSDILGVTKYEQPMELFTGDREVEHPDFHKYTEIENYRNYPDLIAEDTAVFISEKIHGTSCRVGLIEEENKQIFMAGSHNTRKKEPLDKNYPMFRQTTNITNLYWHPLLFDNVKEMLVTIKANFNAKSVIMFCEVYGSIQDLRYGHIRGKVSYAAFDISVDGKYINYDDFINYTYLYEIKTVPILKTDFMKNITKEGLNSLASGKTLIKHNGREIDQIKEGIVIKPIIEQFNPKVGRVILKYISDDYLTRKDGTEFQ